MKPIKNKRRNKLASDIKELTRRVINFRDARDWKQFHNPKDVAIMLINEASEVLEHFRYLQREELAEYIAANREEIEDEMADVLFCLLLLSHEMETDLEKAFSRKMKKTGKKYPVSKCRGKRVKWTKL